MDNKLNYLKNLMYTANELIEEIGNYSHDENFAKNKTVNELNKVKKLLAKIEIDLENNLNKAID